MQLSYELFKQIVDHLRVDNRSEREKRAEPRVGISCEANLVMRAAKGKSKPSNSRIFVRDLSRTGVGLVMPERMPINRSIMIELPSASGSTWIMCTTIYCQELEDKLFKVGARHTRVLPPAEVEKLSSQMFRASPNATQVDRIRVMILK